MDGFVEILSEASPKILKLANQAKAVIVDTFPDVVEVPWPKQKIIGYGVGPKKMSE